MMAREMLGVMSIACSAVHTTDWPTVVSPGLKPGLYERRQQIYS